MIIGSELVQAGLISQYDIMDFVTDATKDDQASNIMMVVASTVNSNPESITKFIKVLCESNDPDCKKLGHKLSTSS